MSRTKGFSLRNECGIITAERLLYRVMPSGSPLARQPPFDGQLYHAASRTWYNMRSANDKAVCSRHMAANAAKQRTAHVTPQPKPALPVSLPLGGRQARMGLLLWYNNRRAVIIRGLCPTARRLRGNRLLMGNDTMPLRGHGIICAE